MLVCVRVGAVKRPAVRWPGFFFILRGPHVIVSKTHKHTQKAKATMRENYTYLAMPRDRRNLMFFVFPSKSSPALKISSTSQQHQITSKRNSFAFQHFHFAAY